MIIERLNEAGARNIIMTLDTCYSGAGCSGQTLMAYGRFGNHGSGRLPRYRRPLISDVTVSDTSLGDNCLASWVISPRDTHKERSEWLEAPPGSVAESLCRGRRHPSFLPQLL